MRKSGAPSFRQVSFRDSSTPPSSTTKSGQAFKAVVPLLNAARNTASILDLLASASSEADSTSDATDCLDDLATQENVSPAATLPDRRPVRRYATLSDRQITSNVEEEPPRSDDSAQVGRKRVYTVCWGKQTTKKHKTYESDGTLEIEGKSAVLKDEDGKSLGRTTLKIEIEEGSVLNVGSKAVQIVELSSKST